MPEHEQLLLRFERDGEARVLVALIGELDAACEEQAKVVLDAAARDDHAELVVDLSRLSFMDSSGIHLLVSAHLREEDGGRRLVVRGASPSIRRILSLTGADSFLHIEPDDRHERASR